MYHAGPASLCLPIRRYRWYTLPWLVSLFFLFFFVHKEVLMSSGELLIGFLLLLCAAIGGLLLPRPKPPRRPDAEYLEFRNDRR